MGHDKGGQNAYKGSLDNKLHEETQGYKIANKKGRKRKKIEKNPYLPNQTNLSKIPKELGH